MMFSQKIKSFIFTAETEKDAYLYGCKQLATIIASKKYSSLSFKVERIEGKNSVRFVLFTNIDIAKPQKDFCKVCKEIHCSFFVNENYNCSRCNMKSFLKRAKHKCDVSKGFYINRIKDKSYSIDCMTEREFNELT